ncbi:MAG TPA: DUF4331 domain-containing protein [Polyangiales bacterium]|nr:DUF4331 domain-containing protein [Polyangiales bacterium]
MKRPKVSNRPLDKLAAITGGAALCAASLLAATPSVQASSHMDAPLITLDDAANTTDVYAFVSQSGSTKFLSTALAVYPFEEPGIGPNNYNFDDAVNYEIHVALGPDVARGRPTLSYQFEFNTTVKKQNTVLRSFTPPGVMNVNDDGQNTVQRYNVRQVDYRKSRTKPTVTFLGSGIVPPNNQGNVTPFYNQLDNGENPAKDGVASAAQLDRYTFQTVFNIGAGHRVFAGQRDDGFYADIQSIFDLLNFRKQGKFDSQGGFNVHTIALNIPVSVLGGDRQVVGVYATTSRAPVRIITPFGDVQETEPERIWAQVGRQGNPLFCEGLIAVADKDLYNRTSPEIDSAVFRKYAETPELAKLINLVGLQPGDPAIESERTDLSAIFIPDLIKTDLSTPRARLAGGGPTHPTNPDDPGFNRLGVFGGDVLVSAVQNLPVFGKNVPGGWPNGRRFGDDVVDIALNAILSDLRPIFAGAPGDAEIDTDASDANMMMGLDRVTSNDIAYNKVLPYAATPHNGRNHPHH